jgi:hypothetical protein
MSKAPDESPQSSTKGYTAAELKTLETLEDAAASTANTGAESFIVQGNRNAAAALAVHDHKAKVAARIQAALYQGDRNTAQMPPHPHG